MRLATPCWVKACSANCEVLCFGLRRNDPEVATGQRGRGLQEQPFYPSFALSFLLSNRFLTRGAAAVPWCFAWLVSCYLPPPPAHVRGCVQPPRHTPTRLHAVQWPAPGRLCQSLGYFQPSLVDFPFQNIVFFLSSTSSLDFGWRWQSVTKLPAVNACAQHR